MTDAPVVRISGMTLPDFAAAVQAALKAARAGGLIE